MTETPSGSSPTTPGALGPASWDPPSRFVPSPWARGPHLQTLVARFLRAPADLPFSRERIVTRDGDFLDLDWGTDPGGDAPIVLVLHGLEGSSRRGYVRNVCAELARRGLWPAALNFRGCSGEPNRTESFYHSGATDDPGEVLDLIRRRHPGRRVGAVGFSLGGNILLKLMGERADGGRSTLDAAVVMSVPFDLAAGCDLLARTPMGRLYTTYFLRSLKRKVRAKEERLRERLDLAAVYRARDLKRFDDLVTAPLHGFDSATHYYHESSSARYLDGVRVPTLVMHAVDDPFLPAESIPYGPLQDNPHLDVMLEARGGHVGFLAGSLSTPRFWADEQVGAYLADRLLRR